MMKKLLPAVLLMATLGACDDDLDLRVPYPDNITLNELALDDFTHEVPDGGFESQGIHFNTVRGADGQLEGGFCYSNRSMRSFVSSEQELDLIRYSVWTSKPNQTEVYAVAHVVDDEAYFTLETPSVVEYILVANTSWAYLAMNYGDKYCEIDEDSGEEIPVANPNVPSEPMGIWLTYVPGGVRKFSDENKDYFRLTATGYSGGRETGTVTFDLACKGANAENPKWSYIVTEWTRMDLASLGVVDKVVFHLDSSDKDAQDRMRTPAWFCLDGIQLQ